MSTSRQLCLVSTASTASSATVAAAHAAAEAAQTAAGSTEAASSSAETSTETAAQTASSSAETTETAVSAAETAAQTAAQTEVSAADASRRSAIKTAQRLDIALHLSGDNRLHLLLHVKQRENNFDYFFETLQQRRTGFTCLDGLHLLGDHSSGPR